MDASYVNIAQGKPVTANGYEGSYVPGNLTDGTEGDLGQVWLLNGYVGWAEIDLLSVTLFTKAIWYPSVSPSTWQTYKLYIDNVHIDTITQYIVAAAPGAVEFNFAPTIGQYVKMEISDSASWISGVEFEGLASVIPEPSSLILISLGFCGLIKKLRKV